MGLCISGSSLTFSAQGEGQGKEIVHQKNSPAQARSGEAANRLWWTGGDLNP